MTTCTYCRGPVDPHSGQVWRRIVGWERKAQGANRRSGSDIVLREPREEYACDDCVRRKKSGLAPLQDALL